MRLSARPLVVIVMLAAWLGGALLFSIVVAPAAFAVLPARALAGALVGRVLPALQIAGLVIGALALVLDWSARQRFAMTRRAGLVLLILTLGVSQFGIGPRIERIRTSVGTAIDALPATDTLRVTFGRLHGLSAGCLGLGMMAATVVIALAAVALARPGRSL